MTVKELIEELQKLDGSLTVLSSDSEYGHGDPTVQLVIRPYNIRFEGKVIVPKNNSFIEII